MTPSITPAARKGGRAVAPSIDERPAKRRRAGISISGLIGLAIVAFWLLMAVAGSSVAPHPANALLSEDAFASFSGAYPLGTDYLGRDMLSRILHGAPYTIGVAFAGTVCACLLGSVLGLTGAAAGTGGRTGRWVDEILSRAMDGLLAIPNKLFALIMVASFGSSVPLLILTAALAYMPGTYRIVRSLAVNVMTMDFIQAARARGEGTAYIIFIEVLPNMFRPALTDFGMRFVYVVLLLAAMSFLGLGVQPPDADWGSLVRENILALGEGAPAVLAPAVAIATLTIGVTMLIDGLGGRGKREKDGV